jgi:hypothetical protein
MSKGFGCVSILRIIGGTGSATTTTKIEVYYSPMPQIITSVLKILNLSF